MGIVKMHRDRPELSVNDLATEQGRSPVSLAKEALRKADAIVFGRMDDDAKDSALACFLDDWVGTAAVKPEDADYVGVRGLLVPSEFGGL